MRISLDLDGYPRNIADCKARFIAWHYDVGVRIYKTAHGFHVESDLLEGLTPLECLVVRESLGDDPRRIRMDTHRIAKGWEWDILFYVKGKYERELVGEISVNNPLRIT